MEIAFAKVTVSPSAPGERLDTFTYVAVRKEALADLLAENDNALQVGEAIEPYLAGEVLESVMSKLAAGGHRTVVIVGTVADGCWQNGPFEGEPPLGMPLDPE